ncbi:MAG: hypothetical protein QOE13_2345 [Gaiellaceae bacterium]|nr:hypothetical protein [Gaiellaceae bacterium]
MRAAVGLAVSTAFLLAFAPSGEGANADRPRVALSVSPAQLEVTAPGSRRISLRNDGAERVAVDVARRSAAGQVTASAWLHVVPARVLLSPGKSAILTLRVTPPRGAEPGAHHVLVLLTTRPLRSGRVTLHLRVGVRVTVQIPGQVVRRLALGGLRVHRARGARIMFVPVANRGNVTLQLRGRVAASLLRHGRRVARLSPASRRVLATGARTFLALRYTGRLRGSFIAVVQVRLGAGAGAVERRYHIRL